MGLRYYGEDSEVVRMAPKLWEEFDKRMAEVKNAVPGRAYGVMCTESDLVSMKKWDYIACMEVRSFEDIPEGMVKFEVPEQTYAIFAHRGNLNKLGNSFKHIYNEWLPQSN